MGLLVSKHLLARSYLLYLPLGLGLIFKINFQAQMEAFWFLTMTCKLQLQLIVFFPQVPSTFQNSHLPSQSLLLTYGQSHLVLYRT